MPIFDLFDQDTQGAIDAAAHAIDTNDRFPLERRARDMIERFRAGVLVTPRWVQRELTKVDPKLRARWCYERGKFILERRAPAINCWAMVGEWPEENGRPIPLWMLVERLKEGDMWRYGGPQEYARHKREIAAAVRARNEKIGDEKVLEAVDSLSSKQMKNFAEVEKAMHTGERITCHGDDLNRIEKLTESSIRAEAEGDAHH